MSESLIHFLRNTVILFNVLKRAVALLHIKRAYKSELPMVNFIIEKWMQITWQAKFVWIDLLYIGFDSKCDVIFGYPFKQKREIILLRLPVKNNKPLKQELFSSHNFPIWIIFFGEFGRTEIHFESYKSRRIANN